MSAECKECGYDLCPDLKCIVCELEQKLAIAKEALEMTISTLVHCLQLHEDLHQADIFFIARRLETARAALEKMNG